jgi:hypothetical protein
MRDATERSVRAFLEELRKAAITDSVNWETITADTGSTSADTDDDNLTITGGEGITTSITGDTLTIDGDDWTNESKNFLTSGTLTAGNVKLATNTISSTNSNGDINLTPNGTGSNVLSKAEITSLTQLTGDVVTIDKYSSFENAISTIGTTTNTTLIINSSTTVSTNTTVTANITLAFLGPGALSIDSGVTVTIKGPIEANPGHQIFSGSGTVSFQDQSSTPFVVYPEWW